MRISVVRRMSNLASRFVGGSEVHVIDPQVDLRHLLADKSALNQDLVSRGLTVDVDALEKGYMEWWTKYEQYTRVKADEESKAVASAAKRELRTAKEALLATLALPNPIRRDLVGKSAPERPVSALDESPHAQYLARQGLVRLDRDIHVVHLVGHLATMLNTLSNTFLLAFPNATLVSPPNMVRAAVLEACNLNVKEYSSFTDRSSSFPLTYLTGHSLPSLVSLFLRAKFSTKTNEWPLCLQSTGMAYYESEGKYDLISCRQRQKFVQLLMCRDESDLDASVAIVKENIRKVFRNQLDTVVTELRCTPNQLRAYESAAETFEMDNVEVARFSYVGEYIPRRANIQHDEGFVHIGYVEVDLYRILAKLVDGTLQGGKEYPKLLKEAVNSSDS